MIPQIVKTVKAEVFFAAHFPYHICLGKSFLTIAADLAGFLEHKHKFFYIKLFLACKTFLALKHNFHTRQTESISCVLGAYHSDAVSNHIPIIQAPIAFCIQSEQISHFKQIPVAVPAIRF